MAKRKRAGHVRVTCPHCNRAVNVQRPQGFQRTMPCPNCRIPIAAEHILAAENAAAEEAAGDDAAEA